MKLITALSLVLLTIGCRENPKPKTPDAEAAADSGAVVTPEVPRVLPEGTGEGPGVSSRVQDQQLIDELVKSGADPKKVHLVEHHLVFANRGQAAKAIEMGKGKGFEMSEIEESEYEKQKSYGVSFIRSVPLDIELINLDRRRMENIAMSLDVDYDGWGCVIVP